MDINRLIFLDSFGRNLTSFKFYNDLIYSISKYYHSNKYDGSPPIITFFNQFFIDPLVLPLLAGLGSFLKLHHKKPTELLLTNTPETIHLIRFLDNSDFFYIVGNNTNPYFPIGQNIYIFNKAAIGGYNNYFQKSLRIEHKLRSYSRNEGIVNDVINSENSISTIRDYLQEYFYQRIKDDFKIIFEDKELLNIQKEKFYFLLSELVVNGVYHSRSEVYAMARTKGFEDTNKNTTFISVVDIGIGLYRSLKNKEIEHYGLLNKFKVFNILKEKYQDKFSDDFYSLFETLCFSMCKERIGFIDLLISCFVKPNTNEVQKLNYFRIHNNTCQLIFSSKYAKRLLEISTLRANILKGFASDIAKATLKEFTNKAVLLIVSLAEEIILEYTYNIQTSSIKIFDIEFPGVHIEMEITEKLWEDETW